MMKETADEWIRPLGIHLKKDKSGAAVRTMEPGQGNSPGIENLLPPKEDVDSLVSFYLDGLEHINRIVHIPTFRRHYEDYWKLEDPRNPPMTMLILAMCSLSTSTYSGPCHPQSLTMRYRHMHKQWLASCDAWLAQAGRKRRKLVHHQVACIVYLSKRVNMIEKKSWWKLTASLVQDAIMDGLHYEHVLDNPFTRELKRRLWMTIRELDLQNSFEFGLPTLLHNICSNVKAPVNVDDSQFDEASNDLPPPSLPDVYTSASYQCSSARSWELRLEISQRLFSSRISRPLSYDDVLRYTSLIMQGINDQTSWIRKDGLEQEGRVLLINTLLLGAMQQTLIALHRPYLDGSEGQSSLSQTICQNISRDVLHSLTATMDPGLTGIILLRGDVLLASLNMIRISLLQGERKLWL